MYPSKQLANNVFIINIIFTFFQHKARNLLKRVGKMEVSRHDGEDFEKANLLLAKFYIDKVWYAYVWIIDSQQLFVFFLFLP